MLCRSLPSPSSRSALLVLYVLVAVVPMMSQRAVAAINRGQDRAVDEAVALAAAKAKLERERPSELPDMLMASAIVVLALGMVVVLVVASIYDHRHRDCSETDMNSQEEGRESDPVAV